MTLTEQIIAACALPSGASLSEIKTAVGRADAVIGVMVPTIVKTGRMTSVGPSGRKRYFADAAHAEAYAAHLGSEIEAHLAAQAERVKARREARNARRRLATVQRRLSRPPQDPKTQQPKVKPKAAQRPIVPSRKPAHEIITPPGIKVQKGPGYTHDPRLQCAPGERVIGPFTLVGIGRDVTTGKPWEKK